MITEKFRASPFVRNLYNLLRLFTFDFKFSHFKNIGWYARDFLKLKQEKNPNFSTMKFLPCLNDKTTLTPIEPVYFFQDTWAAKKLFELKPVHHYDVGSSAKTIGILSQFTPITMVDIRPLPLELPNLNFVKGSILNLPFDDNSVDSISSLCVVEHIGLGRYGDDIDSWGSEKSIIELKRVVKTGGVLLLSVPVDSSNSIYFNAHRAFTRDYVMSMFLEFELLEERYQYGYKFIEKYNPEFGFGTGLYMFKKLDHEI